VVKQKGELAAAGKGFPNAQDQCRPIAPPFTFAMQLGFAMLPGARRRGYTFEAAAATLEFAFNELGLKRIVAITAPHNGISMHILQRLGMRPEGRVHFTADGESQLFGIER